MNLRTRVLVAALRRLPKPDPPTAAYLGGVRRELPRPLARVVLGPVGREVALDDLSVPSPRRGFACGSTGGTTSTARRRWWSTSTAAASSTGT